MASSSIKSHKRKRENEASLLATPTDAKKHKKRDIHPATPSDDSSARKQKRTKGETSKEGSNVSVKKEKDSLSKHTKEASTSGSKDKKLKNSRLKSPEIDADTSKSNSSSSKDTPESGSESEGKADDQAPKNKHAGILSKFERTKSAANKKTKKTKADTEQSEELAVEPVIAKGLEPLPQPENPPEIEEAPTYSSLPPWLANPVRTSAKERSRFSELGIKPELLRILEQNDYQEAFAVQSTVIPLLLDGSNSHPGDLCVSAATGSGKTLSYVLPLVTSLKPRPASRLRGLIVVPTRELVKQAREACELCASGSRLHIGSAVGNVAIKEEQKSLMRVDQVHNPATVAQRQQSGLQGNDWMDFNLEDCVAEAVDSTGFLPGYIQRSEPNVDILICTPGRLVDHLRYTKGFTLKHLEWLVIDEADRLLNESFQEWVDVVMGSLDARHAPETFGPGGKILSTLGLAVETKPPRKVILSATMTRDISKLNSLRLTNPKMVIVGSEDAASSEDPSASHADAHFALPARLHEHVLPVGDESQKPLYLLRLLLSHIKINVGDESKEAVSNLGSSTDSDSTSSDETSSDESSDDETSSSGSDSDSDSGSDSDSDSDSADTSDSESSSDESSDESSASDADDTSPKVDFKTRMKSSTPTVLIFAKSSESASRLSRLISLLHRPLASQMGTIIKSNKSSASRKTLTAFRQGRISVIVATDRASRGLDLPTLTHVVNYDVPTSVTTYVHRVGRTARAGREGSAWTLVAHREGRWFANEITTNMEGRITRTAGVNRIHMKTDSLKSLQSSYAQALDKLENEVKVGKTNKPRSS